jgi:tetratricopeptide (TPR) repeat protein
VLDRAAVSLVDLVELTSLGEQKRVGDCITSVLLQDHPLPCRDVGSTVVMPETRDLLDDLAAFRKKLKLEKNVPKEDLQIKQAAALVVKLEGNARFSSGDIAGAAEKYTEALSLCPIRAKKERVVLYSNRAQCHLLLQSPDDAISDSTRALAIHNPVNLHGKSLWRRAQAYEMIGLAKESLLDAIMFLNETSQCPEVDADSKHSRVPDYVENLVRQQMEASWLFKEAALEHGGVEYDSDHRKVDDQEEQNGDLEHEEDSEWETASETDTDSEWEESLEDQNSKSSKETWVGNGIKKALTVHTGVNGFRLRHPLSLRYQHAY